MKTIIAGIMLLTLSGCGLSLVEQALLDEAILATYDHTLGTLPEITPEQAKEAEKVINPDTDGR